MTRWWIIFFASVSFLLPQTLLASDIKILFWYPGEAGSTEEAKPVMQVFCNYVEEKLPSSQCMSTYINTVPDGVSHIKQELPTIGILSFFSWNHTREKLAGAAPWLHVKAAPGGKMAESYVVVGRLSPLPPTAHIVTSEPLTKSFLHNVLKMKLSESIQLEQTHQMFSVLRNIAEGTVETFALLSPHEARTLEALNPPWSSSLKTVARSEPVPSATVILFDPHCKDKEKLKSILLDMGSDPLAKDILHELRLTGFAPL